jgi:lysophospholipid acyltransferase (LPLAT)-like uncharacterized protein
VAQLAARAREGLDLAVTPDGPRGPRGSVEPGALLVAARADVPIVPVGVAARGAWRAASWDRFLVPRPLARVWVVYGDGLPVAREDAAHAREGCERVARAMAAAEADAEAYASGRRSEPAGGREAA